LPAEYILILHFHEAHDRFEEEHLWDQLKELIIYIFYI
jgi:hypothetical protein